VQRFVHRRIGGQPLPVLLDPIIPRRAGAGNRFSIAMRMGKYGFMRVAKTGFPMSREEAKILI
jgi:hypothetical protein